ncbi:hypothetical protein ZOSMA_60G00140 [Zostera marina]|uniref:Poly(A) RNA polymerase mitochondrial-like central palm domain-containing protein n=1 Tax=Zostera marina TaxID=29655 RepID=A0A0K9NVR0_ZOSMR|nr:hypothetical protein ZOSMA_60G00140 [Zostera marina]
MNRPHAIAAAADNQVLESTLLYILSCINPVAEDRLRRQRTLDDLALLIRNVPTFKDTTIRPFGSFVSGIYSKWGDLDISLDLPTNSNAADSNTKKLKLRALRKLMHVVKNRSFGIHVEFIPSARVPILKFKSRRYNIECDISVDNHVGLSKSTFLLWITQKDKRIHDLVLLIKEWAKAHKINDPKSRTLNSYSLCLLVIFHLQTCEPAILPPLREIFGFTNLCDVIGIERTSQRYMHAYMASIASYRSSNRSSLSKLLISFFEKV